jgi:hypothetical protein
MTTYIAIMIDKSLNETVTDKIRKYRSDYNNNPSNVISFIPDVTSMSGRLHNEFVWLLLLQTHRETDRFVLQLQEFTFRNMNVTRSTSTIRISLHSSNQGLTWLSLTLQVYVLHSIYSDGTPITSKSHTHPSHSQTSRLLTSSLSLGVPVSRSTQCMSHVDSSDLAFSLSSHRHSEIGFIFSSRFIDS